MIARRVAAVGLAVLATIALGMWLVLSQARATAFEEGYLAGELDRLGSYDFIAAEVYPAIVDHVFDQRDERLPDSLHGLGVDEEAARQELLELLQIALPPDTLQAEIESFMAAVLPYVRGDVESLAFEPGLGERLEALAGHEGGQSSALEASFRDLELGTLVVDQLAQRYSIAAFGGTSASLVPGGASVAIGPDFDSVEAGEWFTAELFAAMYGLLPYLRGETDSFAVQVSFEGHEELAFALAELLARSPGQLIADGYQFGDADLRRELALAEDESVQDLDDVRSALSPGWTVTERELFELDEDPEAATAIEDARGVTSVVFGPLRWGALLAALVLLIGAGFLGGRGWASRLMWSGAAALGAALTLMVVVLAGYPLLVEPALRDGLLEATAGWSEPWAQFGPRVAADVENALARAARGAAWRTLPVAVAGALALGAGTALQRRQPPAAHSGAEPIPFPQREDPPERLAA